MTDIDYVRSKKQTAKILNTSERTLDRIRKRDPSALPHTQVSERIIGFRDSVIRRYQDARTAGAAASHE